MSRGDELAINSAEKADHLILRSNFGIFSLDIPRAEFGDAFTLDSIQNGTVQFLPTSESGADGDPDNHALLVFVGFVSEANCGGFPTRSKQLIVEFGVKVECEHDSEARF